MNLNTIRYRSVLPSDTIQCEYNTSFLLGIVKLYALFLNILSMAYIIIMILMMITIMISITLGIVIISTSFYRSFSKKIHFDRVTDGRMDNPNRYEMFI